MTLARKTGRSLFTHRSLPKMFSKTCPSGPLFFKYLPSPASTAFVCPDRASAVQFADTAPADRSVHPVTSLGRAARLLKARGADTIAGALPDLGRGTM